MELSKLSSHDLSSLFEVGCFFILNELPTGTQFAIDGSTWLTGPLFQGVKLIPPGFHIITISPNSTKPLHQVRSSSSILSSASDESSNGPGIGYQVKKGLIRFFKPQEKVIRHFDSNLEDYSKNSHEETITSLDYMKTIDSKLAAYPMKEYDRWKSLTNHITTDQVSRMIGFDDQEDSLLDSLISNHISLSSHPPPPLSSSLPNRTQWGKPRDQTESLLTSSPSKERTTTWPFIDLKRSWLKDAIGPELTKWSRDKSWLFDHLLHHQFKNDPEEILGLLQLSFITFIEVQSIQSFEFYQSLMNLIVKSNLSELTELSNQRNMNDHHHQDISTTLAPPTTTTKSSASPTTTLRGEKIDYLRLNLDIVKVFISQLKSLKTNFFSESMEDFQIENWFFNVIEKFRTNINYIIKFIIKDSINRDLEPSKDDDEQREAKRRTTELSRSLEGIDWVGIQSDCKRFDWNVKDLKISIHLFLTDPKSTEIRNLMTEGDDDEDEDDDDEEDLSEDEDDEFKPIVVN
ncbi:hypothetical protein MJO29_007358 [Puccinia striiformis f. sp. tritici]|nr:hypothetical protein MJO29_007358 [Puccinia striiformis f. sp. tritici]